MRKQWKAAREEGQRQVQATTAFVAQVEHDGHTTRSAKAKLLHVRDQHGQNRTPPEYNPIFSTKYQEQPVSPSQGTTDEELRKIMNPISSHGPLNSVKVTVGGDVKEHGYMCHIIGKDCEPTVVQQNGNIEITFPDAGKGEWRLQIGDEEVIKIIPGPTSILKSFVQ